jgi:uracil phosphoribosyltransferase
MLATGQSIVAVFNQLMERGTLKPYIAVVIAAPEGIAYLENIYLIIAIYGLLILTKN